MVEADGDGLASYQGCQVKLKRKKEKYLKFAFQSSVGCNRQFSKHFTGAATDNQPLGQYSQHFLQNGPNKLVLHNTKLEKLANINNQAYWARMHVMKNMKCCCFLSSQT